MHVPPDRGYRCGPFLSVLGLLGWVCYHSALGYPFIQDDYHHMWESRWRGWASLPHILTVQLPFYRPVSNAWYFCAGDLLWGLNPVPYHAINIAAYVVSAWCVGFLGARHFRSAATGYAAGLIYLTTVGHLLAIYWICVMTAGWLIFWFLVAWACDRRAWETDRRGWRIAAILAYGLCVFSNVTGFTLAAIITLSARLLDPKPPWRTLVQRHWPLYAWGLLWIVIQFGLLGWPDLPNYAVGTTEGGVLEKLHLASLFLTYGISPLYLLVLTVPGHGWTVFGGTVALLVVAALWRYRTIRHTLPDAARVTRRTALLAVFIVAWGLAPYLALEGHFAPYHVGIAAIGFSLALGWLLAFRTPRSVLAVVLAAWLWISVAAIRAYETREHETRGIGWKAALARNVIADLGEILRDHPDLERLVILDYNEHLWWLFEHGSIQGMYYDRPDLEIIGVQAEDGRGIRPAAGQVVVRYRAMHLHPVGAAPASS